MPNQLILLIGKILYLGSRLFKFGGGSTWPGHIALSIKKNFIKEILYKNPQTKVIIVAGTNGKTTTASMIKKTLKGAGQSVFQNKAGANLLNGIASSIIIKAKLNGILEYDYTVLEIDENTLPQILNQIRPDYLIILNLFRDQLDRYGEINTIAEKWKRAIKNLGGKTKLILNADDPRISYLAEDTKTKNFYFGLEEFEKKESKQPEPTDSTFCPRCNFKLNYKKISFSHLGDWQCSNCGLKRPNINLGKFELYPLPGVYNKYNTHASVLTLINIGLNTSDIRKSLANFRPSFGRQEEVVFKNKKIQLFLSKNPTSFNQSFQAITELGATNILIVLNDRIPDGRDISWIWDTNLSGIEKFDNIFLAGDRVYDMALRLKYEIGIKNYESKVKLTEDLDEAINAGIKSVDANQTLFILPTYSAMLEARKILTGKKIL